MKVAIAKKNCGSSTLKVDFYLENYLQIERWYLLPDTTFRLVPYRQARRRGGRQVDARRVRSRKRFAARQLRREYEIIVD